MAELRAPARDGTAADAPVPRPRKRKAADDGPKVDLTNLDMLTACFEWELARFLAQAWTRADPQDSKKSLGLCHCTFLFNYLAGGVASPNDVLLSSTEFTPNKMLDRVSSRMYMYSKKFFELRVYIEALARWALIPTPTTEANGLCAGWHPAGGARHGGAHRRRGAAPGSRRGSPRGHAHREDTRKRLRLGGRQRREAEELALRAHAAQGRGCC
jgi:hypothetical protein